MKKLLSIILIIAVCCTFWGGVFAGTETTNLDVSATVVVACIVSATGVIFPDYDGGNVVYANGDITVTCPDATPYNISLNAGLNYNSGAGHRQVSDGTHLIGYVLNKIDDGNTQWGDSDYAGTYPGGSSLADTGTGTPEAHPVYGGLSTSDAPPGPYTDTVTVTVHY